MRTRSWVLGLALLFAAGCGGGGATGGSGGGGGGGGGGGTPLSSANLNSSDYGVVDFVYLSGQGRAETLSASIDRVLLVTPVDDATPFTTIQQVLSGTRTVQFNGYSAQAFPLPVPVVTDSRKFNEYHLELASLLLNSSVIAGSSSAAFYPDTAYAADIRVEAGRRTNVSIYLDDTMITRDASGNYVFNALGEFDAANPSIEGLFSDFVRFDVSHNASIPVMANSQNAKYVFFSGDRIALGG